MITIIDYGLGNLGSIQNMLRKIGVAAELTCQKEAIEAAQKLILPGVGAFDNGIANLEKLGLVNLLDRQIRERRVPILGICLGAQLMTRRSEEGKLPGLGWIEADTIRFFSRNPSPGMKVPHMGWNDLDIKKASPLFAENSEQRFYFVHSYHFLCDHPEDPLASAHYGYDFTAAFSRGNVFGVQFHPEKSHKFGMELLRRFAAL